MTWSWAEALDAGKTALGVAGTIGGLGWIVNWLGAHRTPLKCEVHEVSGQEELLEVTIVNASRSPIFIRSISWVHERELSAESEVRAVVAPNPALAPGEMRVFRLRDVQRHVQTARALVVRTTLGRAWRLRWWSLRRFSYNYDLHRCLSRWRCFYSYYLDELLPGRERRVKARTVRERDWLLAGLRESLRKAADLPANHMEHPYVLSIAEASIVERNYHRDGHPAEEAFQEVRGIFEQERESRARLGAKQSSAASVPHPVAQSVALTKGNQGVREGTSGREREERRSA